MIVGSNIIMDLFLLSGLMITIALMVNNPIPERKEEDPEKKEQEKRDELFYKNLREIS